MTRGYTVVLAVCSLLMLPAAASTQRLALPASGTAQISGVVTTPDGASQRPLRKALVRLRSGRTNQLLISDDRGRFVFANLPAGRYGLGASKEGFLSMDYGAKRANQIGIPLVLADGQREDVNIALPRGAVISGLVTDAQGQPVPDAGVDILRRTIVGSDVSLSRVLGFALTDDRGVYRAYGLQPGSYLVSISRVGSLTNPAVQTSPADYQWALRAPQTGGVPEPPASRAAILAPSYFPSTTDVTLARPVELAEGQEVDGVNLTIQIVPAVRVSGNVSRSDGQPPPNGLSLQLAAQLPDGVISSSSLGQPALRATAGAAGAFSFSGVPPGRYVMSARIGTNAAVLWIRQTIDVSGRDVDSVVATLRPAVTLTGRLVLAPEATTARPDFTKMTAEARPPTGMPGSPPALMATPDADGSFTIDGIIPGAYKLDGGSFRTGIPGPWTVRSVIYNGRNVTDRLTEISADSAGSVVITLTDKIAALSGRLIDAQNRPVPELSVILIPTDRSHWVRNARGGPRVAKPGSDGQFRFEDVVPGEYYLSAATEVETPSLINPDYVEQFIATATKITIVEGEKKVQDFRVGR